MATASPIDPRTDPVLVRAVQKLRAEEALSDAEREAVRRRGMELLRADLTTERPAGESVEVDRDELLEDEVLSEADEAEGLLRPAREMIAELRAELDAMG